MITSILNQQKNHPVQQQKLQKLADWLGQKLEAKTAPEPWSEVCIVLIDDDGITQTNREYFGKNRPTDVISFRYDPVPGEDDALSGDLIINVDRAVLEGTARGDADYELALYTAHGFDHLSGAEDDTPEKHKKMRATETAWLRKAKAEGLIDGLLG
ncbi:rRNA maturation RNase YbeY [Pontiella sulfatireligans]|uniref:rRNA maturation RNase YbeY n=1 Tax=Pontiella sulfatireligans TaxID=2750658 RepID=UPI0014446C6C|nr:rRNA maturation RNase YbeY [Pontiella sulfatireligans]